MGVRRAEIRKVARIRPHSRRRIARLALISSFFVRQKGIGRGCKNERENETSVKGEKH